MKDLDSVVILERQVLRAWIIVALVVGIMIGISFTAFVPRCG